MKIKTYIITTILLIVFPLTAFTGEVHFYHTDNFGTPMVMTDINGEVVWRSDELPFGEEYETIENPIKNNRRYLRKEMDEETGFIYMGSRYLSPKTGQFNRPDPVGLVDPATGKVNQEMLLNPQRLNRYTYGLKNPYRYVDPDGNFAWLAIPIATAALIATNPDNANAPTSSSAPTYESHGTRNIIAEGASGIALGVAGKTISKVVSKGGGANPFKNKTAKQIDEMFTNKGFTKSGSNPASGTGGYVNPKTGRSFHIDPKNWGKHREPNHVDVNRLRGYKGSLDKKKLPYKRD